MLGFHWLLIKNIFLEWRIVVSNSTYSQWRVLDQLWSILAQRQSDFMKDLPPRRISNQQYDCKKTSKLESPPHPFPGLWRNRPRFASTRTLTAGYCSVLSEPHKETKLVPEKIFRRATRFLVDYDWCVSTRTVETILTCFRLNGPHTASLSLSDGVWREEDRNLAPLSLAA